MSKKTVKVAATYIITIIVTLAAAGLIGKYLLDKLLFQEKDNPTDHIQLERMVSSDEYVPSSSDNRTMLLILDAEKRQSASCFLIARFLADEKQIVFMPLPSNTLAEVGGTSDSIYNFYRNGGSASAIKAVENCLGISIDKYIKFNSSSFSTIVDIFGGVDYDIPYNLIYSNTSTGEDTVIKAGVNHLDSTSLRKVLTYPNYTSGEEYRARCLGIAMTDLLNNNINSSFYLYIDDYFNVVINSDIETDVTSYDYDEAADSIKYVAEYADQIAKFFTVSGTTDENGNYVLDPDFIRSVPEWLELYDSENSGSVSVVTEAVSFPE